MNSFVIHILFCCSTQISLLSPNAVQTIALPDDSGAVKDLHFSPVDAALPGRLALLASLGKKLSIFRCPLL